MLCSLRNFIHVNRRFPRHVSPCFPLSSVSCPFVWFTSFLCVIRYPFVTKTHPLDSNRDWIRNVPSSSSNGQRTEPGLTTPLSHTVS
ncbi:BnaA06g34290D [Brassica napus]|uniref:BnaA06g34290D protein n=1 Tax=Brassica napus TaxID=3708 RepID=A0A078FSW4_BRANA|nr:BnaA06g34290D [Brassica napus]